MIIDPDVARIAKHFGIDAGLIQAVVQAEGDILRAVQMSVPTVTTREQAIEITCRSAVHALSDYVKAASSGSFIYFWAQRWAPQGAKNDPKNLNANWPVNVQRIWMGK